MNKMSSAVSSASSPQHPWDQCIFCCQTKSLIHCLIICGIQLLTPNNLGETWRRICSLDIQSVSALGVYIIVLYKSTFTYLSLPLLHLVFSVTISRLINLAFLIESITVFNGEANAWQAVCL